MSSGYSKELSGENISYFMLFSSCSEKSYSSVCEESSYILRFIKIATLECLIYPLTRMKNYRVNDVVKSSKSVLIKTQPFLAVISFVLT